jgi:hypothetical protein
MPKERAIALRFKSRYLDLKESAGGYPDEALPLFMDFCRKNPAFTGFSEDRVAALWGEAWDDLDGKALPQRLSPIAQLAWLCIKITHEMDEGLIAEALLILWPEVTADQLGSALAELAEQLQREAAAMDDMIAEATLRSGGDQNARLWDLRDGGPLDPEPALQAMYPDPPAIE